MKHTLMKLLGAMLMSSVLVTGCKKDDVSPPTSNPVFDESRIATLEEQIKSLESSIETLRKASEAADNELRSLLESQKQQLEAAHKELWDAIEAFENNSPSTDDSNSARYEELQQRLNELASDLSDVSGRLDGIDGSLGDLNDEVDDMAGDLDNVSGRLDGVDSSLDNMSGNLNDLNSRLTNINIELAGKIADVAAKLDAKLDESQVAAMLDVLKVELEGAIAGNEAHIASCEEAIASLTSNLALMQNDLAAMRNQLGNKLDSSTFEDFVLETNTRMQETAEALSVLSALTTLCEGFEEGVTIKGYIDSAIADVTSLLDDYVLKETYEAFAAEYGTFKAEVEAKQSETDAAIVAANDQIDALKKLIEALDAEGEFEIGELLEFQTRLTALETKLNELENKSHSLDEVNALFTKNNENFYNGVHEIITSALEEDGVISSLMAEAANALQTEFTETIRSLEERVASLEERVGALETKFEDLVKRIQSLVYVPKTSDGKIHIGTTYIQAVDADGQETGPRIEVTPTKKLEYRVSPAELRDALLELPLESFSFYQEHVTRAEGDSMDEFHIEKIEPGNGPGEIYLTVRNEHDFTHQDLAVALCIRYTSDSGIVTEYTSPYTTVVGEGRNIQDRFYVARKLADGTYEPCRNDNVTYLMRYNDIQSITPLFGDDYEVVYDTGESILTLAEAGERLEWESHLSIKKTGVEGAFKNNLPSDEAYSYTLVPADPNRNRTSPVSFTLKSVDSTNRGHSLSDVYSISVTDGTNTVTLIPELKVSLVLIDSDYNINSGLSITWQYSKWAGITGKQGGDTTPYETTAQTIHHGSAVGLNPDNNLSYLPDNVLAEIFPEGAEWTVSTTNAKTLNGTLHVTSHSPEYAGTNRKLAFSIGGYIYNDGTESITLTREVSPSGLVGSTPIKLHATVQLVAPAARGIKLDTTVSATASSATLYYLSNLSAITEPKLSYTSNEVTQFFGGNVVNVNAFLNGITVTGSLQSGNLTMPFSVALGRYGTSNIVQELVVKPSTISSSLSGETTFTPTADSKVSITNGPSFAITGSVKVTSTSSSAM